MNATRANSTVSNISLVHLNKLLQEPDGFPVLADMEREAPGFLEKIGASVDITDRVHRELLKDQTDQNSFALHPNAIHRLGATMKNLAAAADCGVPVDRMLATVSRHNSIRQLTEEQRESLQQAAYRTQMAQRDNSDDDMSVAESISHRVREDMAEPLSKRSRVEMI
jgi:hypothetical protein